MSGAREDYERERMARPGRSAWPPWDEVVPECRGEFGSESPNDADTGYAFYDDFDHLHEFGRPSTAAYLGGPAEWGEALRKRIESMVSVAFADGLARGDGPGAIDRILRRACDEAGARDPRVTVAVDPYRVDALGSPTVTFSYGSARWSLICTPPMGGEVVVDLRGIVGIS